MPGINAFAVGRGNGKRRDLVFCIVSCDSIGVRHTGESPMLRLVDVVKQQRIEFVHVEDTGLVSDNTCDRAPVTYCRWNQGTAARPRNAVYSAIGTITAKEAVRVSDDTMVAAVRDGAC